MTVDEALTFADYIVNVNTPVKIRGRKNGFEKAVAFAVFQANRNTPSYPQGRRKKAEK